MPIILDEYIICFGIGVGLGCTAALLGVAVRIVVTYYSQLIKSFIGGNYE